MGKATATNVALLLGVTIPLLISLELYARHRYERRHARLSSLELAEEQEIFDPNQMRLVDMIQIAPWNDLVYELRPSVRGRFWGVGYRFNSHGMRDRETTIEKPPGAFRIALLGDSFAFGWGVEVEHGYADLLEPLLKDAIPRRQVEVLNFGVPGYNLAMKAACLEHKAMSFDPDLILLEYYENDSYLPNFMLKEPPAPRAYLLEWIREAFALRTTAARGGEDPPRLVRAPFTQNPELVPPELSYMVGVDGVERALGRVRGRVGAAGIPVAMVVITMPPRDRAQLAPNEPASEMAQRLGFVTINTLAAFLRWVQESGQGSDVLMLSEKDPHPSVIGHQILARTVAAHLRASGLLRPKD